MILDLMEVLGSEGAVLPIDAELQAESFDFGGSVYNYVSPLKIEGVVKNTVGVISLHATVSATLSTACARCNAEARLDVSGEINDNIVKGNDDDGIPLVGNTVDLSPLISEAVLTNIPVRVLCNDNCKGLCPVCGVNLNLKQCECCVEDDGKHPFAALKNILLKDEV